MVEFPASFFVAHSESALHEVIGRATIVKNFELVTHFKVKTMEENLFDIDVSFDFGSKEVKTVAEVSNELDDGTSVALLHAVNFCFNSAFNGFGNEKLSHGITETFPSNQGYVRSTAGPNIVKTIPGPGVGRSSKK